MSYNETTKFCTADDILADDWYAILNCHLNSSQDEIDAAYRQLVKKYHPDKNADPTAIKKFYQINSAYQILGDREIRAFYDYESGNMNSVNTFRFKPDQDMVIFKNYIDELTDFAISSQSFDDNIWEKIKNEYIKNKTEFKRNLNIVGTLDIDKQALAKGIRMAFPVYHYKTCGVCRGFGKIGIDEREICYNCEGYGIEEEKIFVYVEIPKNYKTNKIFKVPGRGHKIPAGIGDLIININLTGKIAMRTKMLHTSFMNRQFKE